MLPFLLCLYNNVFVLKQMENFISKEDLILEVTPGDPIYRVLFNVGRYTLLRLPGPAVTDDPGK